MASKRTQEDHTQADSILTLHYAHVLRTQKTARGFDGTVLIALEALIDCVLVTLIRLRLVTGASLPTRAKFLHRFFPSYLHRFLCLKTLNLA